MPHPKGDPKSSKWRPYAFPATNGIAAFAVSAFGTRRRYANTSRMRTTKTCRQACTNTLGVQFGSERKANDLAANTNRRTPSLRLLWKLNFVGTSAPRAAL